VQPHEWIEDEQRGFSLTMVSSRLARLASISRRRLGAMMTRLTSPRGAGGDADDRAGDATRCRAGAGSFTCSARACPRHIQPRPTKAAITEGAAMPFIAYRDQYPVPRGSRTGLVAHAHCTEPERSAGGGSWVEAALGERRGQSPSAPPYAASAAMGASGMEAAWPRRRSTGGSGRSPTARPRRGDVPSLP
jgi:hypothetical protein